MLVLAPRPIVGLAFPLLAYWVVFMAAAHRNNDKWFSLLLKVMQTTHKTLTWLLIYRMAEVPVWFKKSSLLIWYLLCSLTGLLQRSTVGSQSDKDNCSCAKVLSFCVSVATPDGSFGQIAVSGRRPHYTNSHSPKETTAFPPNITPLSGQRTFVSPGWLIESTSTITQSLTSTAPSPWLQA